MSAWSIRVRVNGKWAEADLVDHAWSLERRIDGREWLEVDGRHCPFEWRIYCGGKVYASGPALNIDTLWSHHGVHQATLSPPGKKPV